ncbi:MAG: flagellar protein FlaG [Bacillota bacterium]|nr:flagellar protein FlaG [Bacillota bacterium]
MEVTVAEVRLRHLDMLANTQARHVVPRLVRVPEESAQRATAQGTRRQGAVRDPRETQAEAAAEAEAEAERTRQEQERAERIAQLLAESIVNIRITFHVDTDTGEVTIKVIDNVTGEVVRYIPPEELATMMDHLREFAGLVVDRKR